MPLLSTSKLNAVFARFASASEVYSLIRLDDAVEANATAAERLEKSMKTPGYKQARSDMFAAVEEALKARGGTGGCEADALVAQSGAMLLQKNTEYYLLKGFRSVVTDSPFHIRFEQPTTSGIDPEITEFHLTNEENWGKVNSSTGVAANNHFFFTVEDGTIIPELKNRIRGKGVVQSSDMRLASLVRDTMLYVYYIMYCLRTI